MAAFESAVGVSIITSHGNHAALPAAHHRREAWSGEADAQWGIVGRAG
jgi:hypothetical protein